MTICSFIHSKLKRAETVALLDSGAMENFMNLQYAKYLQLPIQQLKESRKLYNVDGSPNHSGELQYFTNLQVQTGTQCSTLHFFLSDLGENKAILGYPWFAAFQPRIDWKRGWINHTQLPVIFCTPNTTKAWFLPQQINKLRTIKTDRYYIGRIIVNMKEIPQDSNIPEAYQQYSRVFSEDASHKFPPSHIWDHVIELKPNAPAALPGKLIPLSQAEQEELHKFIVEHTKRGTIRPSKSPYKACFFFIKKKDRKL
jgi:hypothetical protein